MSLTIVLFRYGLIMTKKKDQGIKKTNVFGDDSDEV